MTRKRHTEEQIIGVLKDAQAGISVQDLCRKHGISDATFYKWRAKYSGLEVSDVKKLRHRKRCQEPFSPLDLPQELPLMLTWSSSSDLSRSRLQ